MTTTDWVMLGVGVGQIIVLAASGAFIGIQVLQTKHAQQALVTLERAKRASEFIQRFDSPEVDKTRHAAVQAIRANRIEADHHAILGYLNFFFELALAIDQKLADEGLAMAFFRKPLHNYWIEVEPTLVKANNTSYDRVKRLNARWQAKNGAA